MIEIRIFEREKKSLQVCACYQIYIYTLRVLWWLSLVRKYIFRAKIPQKVSLSLERYIFKGGLDLN